MDSVDKQIRDIGGTDCGWDAADHKDFLRIRTKHQGRQVIAFNQEVQRAVPTMDHDQIAEHVQTYELYLSLTDQKKELIQKYKEAKNKQKHDKIEQAEAQTKKLEKVDRQIGLANRAKSAAKRKTSKDIRAELGDWRREKEELNAK